jgi:hypothetical protein
MRTGIVYSSFLEQYQHVDEKRSQRPLPEADTEDIYQASRISKRKSDCTSERGFCQGKPVLIKIEIAIEIEIGTGKSYE